MKTFKLITLFSIFCYSCAQFIPPTGGPIDKQPPRLISSTPKNQTTNFTGRSLSLIFDEWVDISTLRQDLIITPQPKGVYDAKLKGKTLNISFDKNLDSNTTYTFNFRNSVKDLTERNPAKSLKIVISTGSKIDSISLKGKVLDLFTKKPVFDATVALYVPTDSLDLKKHKPQYFIKTDSSGIYNFENIKNSKYILTVFTDKNANLIFDQKNEMFGYLYDTLNMNANKTIEAIEIYPSNNTKFKIRKTNARENIFSVQLDKNIMKSSVITNNKSLLHHANLNIITIFKDKSYNDNDTLNTQIIVSDSLLNQDTLSTKLYFQDSKKLSKNKNLQKMDIYSTLKNGEESTSDLKYKINFDYPIIRFDTNKIVFKTDTLKNKEKLQFTWVNPLNLEIKINTKAKNTAELLIPSNTFENFKADTNSVFSVKNRIIQSQQLSSIEGFVKDKKINKIAQLINAENKNIVQEIKFKDKFYFNNIVPNFYNVKIIEDLNNNGIWDAGNIYKHTKPENISITTEPIKIRENFEIKNLEIK